MSEGTNHNGHHTLDLTVMDTSPEGTTLIRGPAMSPPKRPSVSRRGFLAAMAATSAAVGAFALSARGASAAPWSAAETGRPIGSTARAASQRADEAAHAAHSRGENATLDQTTSARAEDTDIRSFVINVPDADIDDLRRRIAAARWPDRETVTDQSQGAQLERLQALVQYWGADYDWRKVEATLNGLPQFVTTIDGLDIYFIHVS
jgi:hypothetical protein